MIFIVKHTFIITLLFCNFSLIASTMVHASARDNQWQDQLSSSYTKQGADRCLTCHGNSNDVILSIFKNKHGDRHNSRSPMSGLQCEACHGPGGDHAKKGGVRKDRSPILSFRQKSSVPINVQNNMCLQCHKKQTHLAWNASIHKENKLACTSCHRLHVSDDPVMNKQEQPTVCFKCHQQYQSEFQRSSTHPVRFGVLTCTNCHKIHDAGVKLSINAFNNKNERCYECHAEKRGPLLWEHQPVMEDCTICHTPHGSNHGALLKTAVPFLCQQCHSQNSEHVITHNSGLDLFTGQTSTDKRAALQGESCMNCHSKIHGSNHPSGVKLTR